jgi:hypothetical protein
MYIIMNSRSTLEIRAPAYPSTRKSQPVGSPTCRFSADGRRQAGDADATIDEMLGRMKEAIAGITPPKGLEYGAEAEKMGHELLDISRSRIESFT